MVGICGSDAGEACGLVEASIAWRYASSTLMIGTVLVMRERALRDAYPIMVKIIRATGTVIH